MRPRAPLAALLAAVAFWGAACNGAATDAPSDAGSDASADGLAPPAPSDATAAPSADAGDVDAGDAGDEAVTSTAQCFIYCDRVERSCTGEMKQFVSRNACLRACNLYPEGQPSDSSGNTRYCRALHSVAAEDYVDQRRGHCLHAGAYGYGGCGEPCEAFCVFALRWCTTSAAPPPYATEAECLTACNAFEAALPAPSPGIPQYNAAGPLTGDSVDCRQVHMMLALESTSARDLHCPAVAVASTACK
ncbi:MAG: hypothetical protein KC657_31455 [Myxococcales bacterium]|nr:hypothetical protein [Myxococcales bacterium]